MNSLVAIAFLFVFPLNVLAFLPDVFFAGKSPAEKKTETPAGEVRGFETEREEKEEIVVARDLFPLSPLQPIRKKEAKNLAISTAHASLILDVDSGTILHYSNGKQQRQIASLSKIMTAVIVMEKVKDLEESVVIDKDAVYIEGTKIGCPRSGYCISQRLQAGEKVTVMNLMKAMLMNSANDAAVALAKHTGGSERDFVKLMNEKAKKLGLKDTNFCTASGLETDGRENECYSTAYDIARIAAYAAKYDVIWKIFRLPNNTTITSIDGKYSHEILNTNQLLDQMPNCLGAKTGFTPLAGHSLFMVADDNEKKHKVVAVVLNDPYRWQSVKTMVEWAFQSYEWK